MNNKNKKPVMQEFTMSARYFMNQDKESFVNKPIIMDGRPIGIITDAKFEGNKLTVLCMMYDKVYDIEGVNSGHPNVEYSVEYLNPTAINLD